MATEKDKKPKKTAKAPVRNANMIGGNHQGTNKDAILKEGRASYKNTVDKKLGTNHAQTNAAHKNNVKHIVPGELGSGTKTPPGKNPQAQQQPAAKNSWAQKVQAQRSNTQNQPAKQAPPQAKQQTASKEPAKGNSWVQKVNAQRQAQQPAQQQTKKEQPAKTQQPPKSPTRGR